MKKSVLSLSVAAGLMLSACVAPSHQVSSQDLHHQNHHKEHHHKDHHHWDYNNAHQWGDVELNKLCKVGQAQSPINITQVVKSPNVFFDLRPSYQAQDFTITNNGHAIVFDAVNSAQGVLDINGTRYELLQFHYHIPSEHTVMNAYYPLELHFVHKNAEGGLAVIGVLVDKGAENPQLAKILTDLPTNANTKGVLKGFDVSSIIPKNSETYAYDGSLTTPPCGEQVQWLLKSTPIHASASQLAVLSALYDGNNRPIQPQGARTVYLVE